MKAEQPYIHHCAVIILAGGKSARLGKPKQLLKFNGKTFLQHALDTAELAGLGPVIVVLGSQKSILERGISGNNVLILENKNWEEGMASSIRAGVEKIKQLSGDIDGTVIMVCDQPFVSPDLLNTLLITQRETGKAVVASSYESIAGTPVIFHQSVFAQLMELKGEKGARKFLEQNPELVATISFPAGKTDIDTIEEYEKLKMEERNPAT